jgi:prefoldin subunit 5
LEQSINNRYNDLKNKITNLDEKVDSILSIANDLHTTSPTINDAAPDTPKKTK